jgi:antitoxin PrlF
MRLDAVLQYCNAASMKTTITVTSRGVVTLPLALRRALGIKGDDVLIAETTAEGLLLRPAVTLPVEIYTERRIREFDDSEAELAQVMRPLPRSPATRRTRRA